LYGLNVESIDLSGRERQSVEDFLSTFDLLLEKDVEKTFIARENGAIVGTCSVAGNILKCFAVSPSLQGQGLGAQLITQGVNHLFDRGILEYFVYTLPKNRGIFEDLGMKEVYTVDGVSLLEGGKANIRRYVEEMVRKSGLTGGADRAALVMNCNPFTLGHRYLIEQAAGENAEVVIFIVEEDKSEFPFRERIELVRKGVADLTNVTVIPGGQYIISSATFPTYFLKEKNEKLSLYTKLDAGLFARHIAPAFHIKRRYVGTEPYCEVTGCYNQALEELMPAFGIELRVIDRMEKQQHAISASMVREKLHQGEWDKLKELVPEVTLDYLRNRAKA